MRRVPVNAKSGEHTPEVHSGRLPAADPDSRELSAAGAIAERRAPR